MFKIPALILLLLSVSPAFALTANLQCFFYPKPEAQMGSETSLYIEMGKLNAGTTIWPAQKLEFVIPTLLLATIEVAQVEVIDHGGDEIILNLDMDGDKKLEMTLNLTSDAVDTDDSDAGLFADTKRDIRTVFEGQITDLRTGAASPATCRYYPRAFSEH